MKLCKDCKHCRPETGLIANLLDNSYKLARCAHELSICVVSGEAKKYCSISRENSHDIKYCTPEARYFEPK